MSPQIPKAPDPPNPENNAAFRIHELGIHLQDPIQGEGLDVDQFLGIDLWTGEWFETMVFITQFVYQFSMNI